MITNEFHELRDKLVIGIKQLHKSVLAAREQMIDTYGETHDYVMRIDSYIPAIEIQYSLVLDLDACFKNQDVVGVQNIALKITAISDMIKLDSQSLLNVMNTGKDLIPEDAVWH